jgi:hypothetical protein
MGESAGGVRRPSLRLLASLEALNRRIPSSPQYSIDSLHDEVVNLGPLLEGDFPERLVHQHLLRSGYIEERTVNAQATLVTVTTTGRRALRNRS